MLICSTISSSKMVGADSRVGPMAASFPNACLQAKLFFVETCPEKLLEYSKQRILLKCTEFIACLLKLEIRKHVCVRYWKANKRLHVMNYQRKTAFISKKDSRLTLKEMDSHTCQSVFSTCRKSHTYKHNSAAGYQASLVNLYNKDNKTTYE